MIYMRCIFHAEKIIISRNMESISRKIIIFRKIISSSINVRSYSRKSRPANQRPRIQNVRRSQPQTTAGPTGWQKEPQATGRQTQAQRLHEIRQNGEQETRRDAYRRTRTQNGRNVARNDRCPEKEIPVNTSRYQ
jgi:hypothetical protein